MSKLVRIENPTVNHAIAHLMPIAGLRERQIELCILIDTLFDTGNEVLRPNLMLHRHDGYGFVLDYCDRSPTPYARLIFTTEQVTLIWRNARSHPPYRACYIKDLATDEQLALILYHITNPDLTKCT